MNIKVCQHVYDIPAFLEELHIYIYKQRLEPDILNTYITELNDNSNSHSSNGLICMLFFFKDISFQTEWGFDKLNDE